MSIYESVGLPTPPPGLIPNPDYPRYAPLQTRLKALRDAGDLDGFNALLEADPQAGARALELMETVPNPLYWDYAEEWSDYCGLVVRWRFREAREFYLERLHPHVGEALGWIDPFTLGTRRRPDDLTDAERLRIWNAFWGWASSVDDDVLDEGKDAVPATTRRRALSAAKGDADPEHETVPRPRTQ